LGTHRIVKPALVLLEGDAIGKRLNEDSSLLGVTTNTDDNPSGTLLQIGEKVQERDCERGPD